LIKKSAGLTPLTGALKVTVMRSSDSTVPAGGSTETMSRAAHSLGIPRISKMSNRTMV
jgi:hypothetical protein